jgi:hypothetical protein
MVKKKFINKKTGQTTTNEAFAQKKGFEEQKNNEVLIGGQKVDKGKTLVGGQQLNKQELEAFKLQSQRATTENPVTAQGNQKVQQALINKGVPTQVEQVATAQQAVQEPNNINIPIREEQEFGTQGRQGVLNAPGIRQLDVESQAIEDAKLIKKIRNGQATNLEIKQAITEFSLTEIDLAVIRAGEAQVSKLSQRVDSLTSLLPGRAKKYVPLFQTPSKEALEVQDNLKTTKESITLYSDLIKQNPQSASQYGALIKQAERDALRMQSTIKLMTIQSPALQANPEQIISIETEIDNLNLEITKTKTELALLGIFI